VVGAVAISQSGETGGGGEETFVPFSGQPPAEERPQASGGAGQRLDGAAQRRITPASEDGAGAISAEQNLALGDTGSDAYSSSLPPPGRDGGGIARGTDERLIDASARLTLGAEAEEVQDVANRVIDVTDSYEGVVLNSQVTSDQAGARASFTLEIPYRELDAALEDLSGLADVISLTEQGEDITARAVRTRRQLADVRDRIAQARIELIRADTREQRLIIKSQISSLEARADVIEQQLGGVKRQARFATVAVEVTSNGPDADEEGGWSLGDALADAGRVLEVIAGIALISLAVLAPLALLGVIAWLVISRMRARGRERALDE
jgi:hypothetical protein